MRKLFWRVLAIVLMILPAVGSASNGQNTGGESPTGGTPPSGPGGESPTGGVSGGKIDLPNPLNADSIAGILDKIINFLLVIAVPVAIIMAIYAGYLFMTGGASEEKIKTARKTLLYVVIGVAVLILSKGLVNLVASFLKT